MTAMHVVEDAPAGMILEMDSAQKIEQPRHGLGCMGIVLGIMVASVLIFFLFGYPYYHSSRAWLFWTVTVGLFLTDSFVIYLANFVAEAVNHGMGKQQ